MRQCRSVDLIHLNRLTRSLQAGPNRCALALNGTSVIALNSKIRTLITDLYKYPLPVPHAGRPGVLTSTDVSSTSI